jgi:hypothetical protein
MNVGPSDSPVVILGRGKMLRDPSNSRLAAESGIQTSPARVRLAGRRGGPGRSRRQCVRRVGRSAGHHGRRHRCRRIH